MKTINGDNHLHVFSTFMGIVPDTDTPPVCGAILTSAYDGRNKTKCPKCLKILQAHLRAKAKADAIGKAA